MRGREMKIAIGEEHDGKGVSLTEGNCQLEKSELKEETMEVEVGAKEDRTTKSQDDGVGGKTGCLPWLAVILQGVLCHLYQRLALEGDKSNADLTHQVSYFSPEASF